jgi:HD superfamily phosphohydrolase
LTAKALQTAEHLLISRYFDYRRSNYHKTVAALELVLKDVVEELLRAELLDCTAQRMSSMIGSGEWAGFDDANIMRLISSLHREAGNEVVKHKARSVLYRTPPRLICDMEYFGRRGDTNFRLQAKTVKNLVPKLAEEFSIDPSLFYVWDQAGMPLTKVGSSVPLSTAYDDKEELAPDRYQQLIRILNHDGQGSTPIVELRHSMMSILSDQAWYAIRLYALLPQDVPEERSRMRTYVLKHAEEIPWK